MPLYLTIGGGMVIFIAGCATGFFGGSLLLGYMVSRAMFPKKGER